MKRILLFAALATFILSSCEKSMEQPFVDGDQGLSFSSRVIDTTEGTKVADKTAWVTGDEVGIFGFGHSGAYTGVTFDGVYTGEDNVTLPMNSILEATVSGSTSWALQQPSGTAIASIGWPAEKASFIAYYPRTTTAPNLSGGVLTIPWDVSATKANQKDLLWDVIVDASAADRDGDNSTTASGSGATQFKFAHALAKVKFKAVAAVSGFKITSIALNKVSMGGDFKIKPIAGVNQSTGTWTNDAVSNGFSVYTSTGGWVVPTTANWVGTNEVDCQLLMVPQSLGTTASNATQIVVGFTVNGNASTNTMTIANADLWDKNKVYVYTLNMNTEKITLSCAIDDWANSDVGLVIIDFPDLTPEPVANSYIIAPGENVSLPVVERINQFWASSANGGVQDDDTSVTTDGRGYTATEGLGTTNKWINTEAWTAEIIWTDIVVSGGIGSKISLQSRRTGDVPLGVNVDASMPHGNIVIGVKKAGVADFLWSWHLWITDFDPEANTATLPSGLVVMDRNMGAITDNSAVVGSYGLLYQWGRKDPFVGSGVYEQPAFDVMYDGSGSVKALPNIVATGSLDLGIKNPMIRYGEVSKEWVTNGALSGANGHNRWGGATSHTNAALLAAQGEKTIYDPCPVGWMVPSNVTGKGWLGLTLANTVVFNGGYKYTDGGGEWVTIPKAMMNTTVADGGTGGQGQYHFWGGSTINGGEVGDGIWSSDGGSKYYNLYGRACMMVLRPVKDL